MSTSLRRWQFLEILPLIVIGYGIAARLAQYVCDRALWYDEVALALNLIERSGLQLLAPLNYEQAAPIGFLLAVKLCIQTLGNHEFALRLFPFSCSVASLVLFYLLLKRYFQGATVLIGITLLATAEDLIYYASELKQYSSDVAVALLCFGVAAQLGKPELSKRQIAVISASGALLIWFSHPAIFVLAGGSLGAGWLCLRAKIRLHRFIPVITSWLLSFLIFYWGTLTSIESRSELKRRWGSRGAFPESGWDLGWLLEDVPHQLFGRVVVFGQDAYTHNPLVYLAALLWIAGCIAGWQKQKPTLLLALPVLLTLGAAAIGKYPFHSRLILFLAPFAIALVAEGTVYLGEKIRFLLMQISAKFNAAPIGLWSGWAAMTLLISAIVLPSSLRSGRFFQQPIVRQNIKPPLNYIQAKRQPGDYLYVFPYGYPATPSRSQFRYYRTQYNFAPDAYEYILGTKWPELTPQSLEAELGWLKSQSRVWILFSLGKSETNPLLITQYQTYLQQIGTKIDQFQTQEHIVQLYQINASGQKRSPKPPATANP